VDDTVVSVQGLDLKVTVKVAKAPSSADIVIDSTLASGYLTSPITGSLTVRVSDCV
jgi:O-acetylhomoserine/O-acetylserine sulfhydrylase-like pyridoxal-dependent enzyme